MGRFLSLAAVLALAGCQTPGEARIVSRKPDSGVVAIARNTTAERDRAIELIANHVGPKFVIEKEEVVPLTDTSYRKRDQKVRDASNPLGRINPQDILALETPPASEHRIHYRRASSVASPEPAVLPASAMMPASAPVPTPTREATPVAGGPRSFLPLTCEGCQGR